MPAAIEGRGARLPPDRKNLLTMRTPEVLYLLEAGAASTLVVSQDVDLAIPVEAHAEVRARLDRIRGLGPSSDAPSIWVPLPERPDLIEVNFIGVDHTILDPIDTYERPDDRLPLMVFGPLSLLRPAAPIEADGLRIPVPRAAGLALEKLVTDRTGEKGDRDLLVVAGLLSTMSAADVDELAHTYQELPAELRHQVRTNLSILSLIEARPSMPDPGPHRATVATLLVRLEAP
ncbi:MAG: hypothetical protein K8H88_16645 [Sandaracinaceae bacterium]|nr:hypothetical protein [Sandaracinaceae bacterium]